MKKAITNLNKELNDLEPMERETFVSISVYLLMTTLFNGAIGVQPSKRVEAMEPVSIAV